MAPLQKKSLCLPCETGISNGPLGKQFSDNDGHMNSFGGRPDERHGLQGSYTHGVTIFSGGVPHDVRPPKYSDNCGTLLYSSTVCKPDMRDQLKVKPGTADERQGPIGLQAHRTKSASDDLQPDQLNHGIVLASFPHLKPNMCYGGYNNACGGRPYERLGKRGGFLPGVQINRGGVACSSVLSQELNHGTVLFTSNLLKPDHSHDPLIKPGTSDERQGRCGSFEHGDIHLSMPTVEDAKLWKEAGQKDIRRFAPGHYLAGVTIMKGMQPTYK